MKINIITMHRVFNYGSVLQTYSLSKYLQNKGHDVEIIDYIPKRFRLKEVLFYVNQTRNKSILHKLFYIVVCLPGRLLHKQIFEGFIRKNYKLTSQKYYNIKDLRDNIPQSDIYITGSDQVWNSGFENYVDEAYYLDFVPKEKKRIAYAASFGKSSLETFEKEQIKELISNYDNISVREDSAIDILESLEYKDAIQVLDPTLLLDREQWEDKASKRLTNQKYVLIYQLNPNPKIVEHANKIAKEKNLKVAKFGWDYLKPKGVDINFAYKKPEDFLSAIKYAEYIVTDSFHGTIFSIKFNKKFICVAPPKYRGRLDSILKKLGLEDRMISDKLSMEKIIEDIDYNRVNKILLDEKNIAEQYLLNAIEN